MKTLACLRFTRIHALILLLAVPTMSALQREAGTVTGQIRSINGTLTAGIRVTAVAEPQPGIPATDATTLERLTTTDMEGRYRLEDLRPGRYFIAAGFVDRPTYYPGVSSMTVARLVTVAAGVTTPGVDFTLAEPAGVRVTGRVVGLPTNMPPGYIRVLLSATGPPPRPRPIDTEVARDGTFEFQKVPPGFWSIRAIPSVIATPPNFLIEVKDTEVGSIELVAADAIIVGQVTVEDGRPLPVSTIQVNSSGFFSSFTNANGPSLMQLLRVPANRAGATASLPGSANLAVVGGDGSFIVVNLPVGEYRIGARVPFGFAVKSMTLNEADILQTTIKIDEGKQATGNLRVVLTRAPSSAGVRVSGRVVGKPLTAAAWISMQPSGDFTEGGTGEVMVRPDGTFEFIGVPHGVYAVQLLRSAPPGVTQLTVTVENMDLTNLEIPNY